VHLYRGPDALQDFQAVLRLEPNNRQAKEEVQVRTGFTVGAIETSGKPQTSSWCIARTAQLGC
jgi:hypothetical protein